MIHLSSVYAGALSCLSSIGELTQLLTQLYSCLCLPHTVSLILCAVHPCLYSCVYCLYGASKAPSVPLYSHCMLYTPVSATAVCIVSMEPPQPCFPHSTPLYCIFTQHPSVLYTVHPRLSSAMCTVFPELVRLFLIQLPVYFSPLYLYIVHLVYCILYLRLW